MDKQMMVFEGNHVMVMFHQDVNFEFEGDFIIRGKDVADVLEYRGESATFEVLKFCKDKHVYHVKNSDMVNRHVRKLNNAGEKFISNLALNRVLGQSGQPKAEMFQDWVYEDVVPSVQKHGAYLTSEKLEEAMEDPDTFIRLLTKLKDEKEKRLLAEKRIEEVAPRLAYLDAILKSKGTVTTSQIAKDYGLTAPELNKLLRDGHIQYKVNGQWLLYKGHADKGYTQSYTIDIVRSDGSPDVKMNTQWTQRGRVFIHELLQGLGIKANIDKDYDDAK